MTDTPTVIRSLVTRLCAAKVCQNYQKYPIIDQEMKTKSKSMGYGLDLKIIPPFVYSHLLYNVMGKFEKDIEQYEKIVEMRIAGEKEDGAIINKNKFNTFINEAINKETNKLNQETIA